MTFTEYLDGLLIFEKQEKFNMLVQWVQKEFPQLTLQMKWNQPMFINKNTFIIAFSYAKNHISVSPERLILEQFLDRIKVSHTHTKMLYHIKWKQEIDYNLIKDIITSTIEHKKDYTKFWL